MYSLFFNFLLLFLIFVIPGGRNLRFLPLLIILLQFSIFCLPLKRIYTSFTNEGILLSQFLLIIFFSLLVQFILKYKKKKTFISKFFILASEEINKAAEQIIYLNKHTYYVLNKHLIKIKNFVFFLENPWKFLELTFVLPNLIVLFLVVGEIFYKNSIFFAVILFLILLISQKFFNFILNLLIKISKNTINYNYNQMTENFLDINAENFRDISFWFLQSKNLNDLIFLDRDFTEKHLLEKYQIFISILGASKIWLLVIIFKKLSTNLRILVWAYMFFCLVASFFFLTKFESNFIFFDFLLFFLLFKYLFYKSYLFCKNENENINLLLKKLIIDIPTFLDELKKLYLTENLVTAKDISDIPRVILVKNNPQKPSFFEGFEDITFFEETTLSQKLTLVIKQISVLVLLFIIVIIIHFLLSSYFPIVQTFFIKNFFLFIKIITSFF